MRSRLGLLAFIILLFQALPALGSAASSDKATELIERSIRAHGGRDALTQVEDAGVRTGTLYIYKPAPNQARFIMFSRGEKTRVDLDMAGIPITIVFDEVGGWMRTQGQVIALSERQRTEQERMKKHDLGKLAEYDGEGCKTAYLGASERDGRTTEGVSITDKGGTTTEFYLDPETWLVAAIAYEDINLDTQAWSRNEALFSDYRPVGGVPTPYRLDARIDGVLTQAMEFTVVDVAAPVPEDIFLKPGAGSAEPVLSESVTIPCRFVRGALYVDASVNGNAPVRFMFDTGAGLTILDAQYATELGLAPSGEIAAASAGGSIAGSVTTMDQLSVGGVGIKNVQAMTADLDRIIGVKGILGYNVLNQFATTIDYAAGTITLSDPDRPLVRPEGSYLVAMDIHSNTPHVKARLDGAVDVDMAVDTGASMTIVPHRVIEELKPESINSGLFASGAEGEKIPMSKARLRTLEIGDAVLTDVEVSFPSDPDRADPTGSTIQSSGDGTLGNTVLCMFRVTINYDQQSIILEPGDPARWVRVGISPEAADGEIRVRAVTPGSSAEEQGVRAGDVILEIDGRPVRLLEETARLLQGPAGSKVKIKLRRGDAPVEVTLERRSIL